MGGWGECIFIYSGLARLISFEINLISKEINRVEPEYMNMHFPINALDPPLLYLYNHIYLWYTYLLHVLNLGSGLAQSTDVRTNCPVLINQSTYYRCQSTIIFINITSSLIYWRLFKLPSGMKRGDPDAIFMSDVGRLKDEL